MIDRNSPEVSVCQTQFWSNKFYEVRAQTRVAGRDGSTATRSSSMTLKLVNGGVPTTVRAAVAELAGGVQPVVTLISPSACMWSCLLCNSTGEN